MTESYRLELEILTEAAAKRWRANEAVEVDKFKRALGCYVPHILDDDELAREEMWHLVLRTHLADSVISHKAAQADLEEAVDALRRLGGVDSARVWVETDTIDEADRQRLSLVQRARLRLQEIILDLKGLAQLGLLEPALQALSQQALRAIAEVPDKGRTGWQGIYAIQALRSLWSRSKWKKAPLNFNPASEFAYYLQAGFDYLNVSASVPAALRAYRAHLANLGRAAENT